MSEGADPRDGEDERRWRQAKALGGAFDFVEKLSASPPTPLYHYTSSDGFLGIVGLNEMHATNAHYMNDRTEFGHAIELGQEWIRSSAPTANATAQQVLEGFSNALSRIARVNVFVASFSKVPDLLSQWRGYCSGGGYCLGFSTDQLRVAGLRSGFRLVRCIYGAAEQRRVVDQVLAYFLNQHTANRLRPTLSDEKLTAASDLMANTFCTIAPVLKHEGFREEEEWRLVSFLTSCVDAQVGYKSRQGAIVPFYRIPLTQGDSALELPEIIVGPTNHQQLAQDAASMLIAKVGARWHSLRSSNVPFRTW